VAVRVLSLLRRTVREPLPELERFGARGVRGVPWRSVSGGDGSGSSGWLPAAEPRGEVGVGPKLPGQHGGHGSAELVGAEVDALALKSDAAGPTVPEAFLEVVVHRLGVLA